MMILQDLEDGGPVSCPVTVPDPAVEKIRMAVNRVQTVRQTHRESSWSPTFERRLGRQAACQRLRKRLPATVLWSSDTSAIGCLTMLNRFIGVSDVFLYTKLFDVNI